MRIPMFYRLSGMCLFLMLFAVAGAEDESALTSAKIMEQKLQLSQAILAAVVKEDFVSMSAKADSLLVLAKTEWIQDDTPQYRAQLKDFWIVLDGLKSAADDKNGDGATLAYVQMTLSCVKCHKYLRTPPK